MVGAYGLARVHRALADRTGLFETDVSERPLVGLGATDLGSLSNRDASLVLAAQRVMADRDTFTLSEDAAAEWEAINARPARELEGLRRLMARPSPFDE